MERESRREEILGYKTVMFTDLEVCYETDLQKLSREQFVAEASERAPDLRPLSAGVVKSSKNTVFLIEETKKWKKRGLHM